MSREGEQRGTNKERKLEGKEEHDNEMYKKTID